MAEAAPCVTEADEARRRSHREYLGGASPHRLVWRREELSKVDGGPEAGSPGRGMVQDARLPGHRCWQGAGLDRRPRDYQGVSIQRGRVFTRVAAAESPGPRRTGPDLDDS